MTLAVERPHEKHGSAMFVKNGSIFESTSQTSHNSIKMLSTTLNGLTITSVHKLPNEPFCITPVLTHKEVFIGDFNSHSTTWGYENTNNDGEAVEQWAEVQNLNLIHGAKLPKLFNSKRWKKGYNTDLAFVSSNIVTFCNKLVRQPIPWTQHRPIGIKINAAVMPKTVPFQRRFNYTKANWQAFSEELESYAGN